MFGTNDVDLSYIYVQTRRGGDWQNVGLLAECPDDDQARVLPPALVGK